MRLVVAALAAGILLGSARAHAQAAPASKESPLSDEVVGITLRGTAGAFAGSNAEHVSAPELGFGASLHFHLYQGLFLELSWDQRIPALAVSSNGTMNSIGVGQEAIGLRERLPLDSTSNLVLGAGAGGASLHYLNIDKSPVYVGTVLYGTFGWEKRITGGGDSKGTTYVGVEAVWNHYLVSPKLGFQGGLGEARLTFTYYFGRGDLSDCR